MNQAAYKPKRKRYYTPALRHHLIDPKTAAEMNFSDLQLLWNIGLFVFIFLTYALFHKRKTFQTTGNNSGKDGTMSHKEAPEPAGAWPLIGHLHLIGGGDKIVHHQLGYLADRYGPAFNIRLGSRRAFVVSSWEVAKECFTVNDKALASRPTTLASKVMAYNSAVIGFAPYSPHWRQMRKIATLELLSNRRLEMLKHVRVSEIDIGIKELYSSWTQNGASRPVLVELKKWIEDMMLNVIVRMVAGKRYFGVSVCVDDNESEARRCQEAISKFFELMGVFVVSDAIPLLWWFDFQGHERKMKRTAKEVDFVIGGWLAEHRQRRHSGNHMSTRADSEPDFIDVMLSLEEAGELSSFQHDSDTSIKSTSLAMILGGSDSTSGTLTWAMSLLLNNPHALKKMQEELDLHVGLERQVDELDIKNLVYLQAVVKETLRLYPPGPLLGPREAMQDCSISGYHVAAGTRLMVNVWKIQRDPRVWKNPNAFQPERFLTTHAHVDVRGKQFELFPFGSGRRSCPGMSFALQVVPLALARLVQAFHLAKPSVEPIDMTENPGFTIPKATPLEVLLKPRLATKLYGC